MKDDGLLLQLARLRPAADAVQQLQALVQGAAEGGDEGATLVRLAVEAGVAPLLHRHLPKSPGIPKELLGALWGAYHANVQWNGDALAEIARMLDALRSSGVDAIPLKGAVAAVSLLGDAGLYAGSDIDLLVRRERLDDAVRVLRASGYADSTVALADSLRISYHHCLERGGFRVEVHWNLVQAPFEAEPDFWWEDAAPCITPAGAAWSLSAEKYLLYLLYRLYTHGFAPLRLFVLPTAVADGCAGPVDWRRLVQLARLCRMERLTRFALAFIKDRLGADVPEEIAATGRAPRRLHDRIALALTGGAPIRQLTRVRMYTLFDSPVQVLRTALRRIFPPVVEIRWRYGLQRWGWRLPVLYVLNPVLLLVETGKRRRFLDRFLGGDDPGRRQ